MLDSVQLKRYLASCQMVHYLFACGFGSERVEGHLVSSKSFSRSDRMKKISCHPKREAID